MLSSSQMRLCFTILFATLALTAQTAALNGLEKEFKEALTGATLEGQSSRDGKEGVSPDKYNIEKIEKTSEGNWTFFVKVSFRGQEMTVPMPLEVKWAGDTPVITVNDKGYPGTDVVNVWQRQSCAARKTRRFQ